MKADSLELPDFSGWPRGWGREGVALEDAVEGAGDRMPVAVAGRKPPGSEADIVNAGFVRQFNTQSHSFCASTNSFEIRHIEAISLSQRYQSAIRHSKSMPKSGCRVARVVKNERFSFQWRGTRFGLCFRSFLVFCNSTQFDPVLSLEYKMNINIRRASRIPDCGTSWVFGTEAHRSSFVLK